MKISHSNLNFGGFSQSFSIDLTLSIFYSTLLQVSLDVEETFAVMNDIQEHCLVVLPLPCHAMLEKKEEIVYF